MSEITAIFAGTFDPVTNGHLDIVRRAGLLFDRVVVSVAAEGRETLFSADERVALFREALGDVPGITVEAFDGLVVDQARRHGARATIRGIRNFQDWDYEMQMAFANRGLHGDLDTVFLPPSAGMTSVSSSLVREVASLGGDVAGWVPECVVEALRSRFDKNL
jgi:pantetheine-phosphate adenylyltransferase